MFTINISSVTTRPILDGLLLKLCMTAYLPWFISFIYYWNLQFLNNVIINKTKVLLPQT